MKVRNVPKELAVIATPNASADKQTSKQPRIAKNGDANGVARKIDLMVDEMVRGRGSREGVERGTGWVSSIWLRERRAKNRERASSRDANNGLTAVVASS
jgi:hypothetical protein